MEIKVNNVVKNCLNKLIHGDCLEVMQDIPDSSIDMILCDLPYGTTRNKWDSIIDLERLWSQYERVIKDNGAIVLFAQTPFDKVLGSSNLRMLKYEWVWQKEQGTGFLNAKKMPLKEHENILVFYKQLPTYNPQMKGGEKREIKRKNKPQTTTNYGFSMQPTKSEYTGRYPTTILQFTRDKEKHHPTQKPVALLEYLVKTYTNEGEIVLDNTMGSGSTGEACVKTNRSFIGIEKDDTYFNIAKERLENYINNK